MNGRPPEQHRDTRDRRCRPLLESLKRRLEETLGKLSKKSDTVIAVRYALGQWDALMRYCDDGRLEIDNNVALGRKNYLFAGSDRGDKSAAAIYSLIGTAKLDGIDPESYRIEELLPWKLPADGY
jgi:transposase